ncbi:uncharacterized protein LOC114874582 [Osmia bicornis bicornis]|uniref:uncharacterized protein LOC114874582 n=1 Tax=Osmia bicornis bicornis TaxID=1437191 RepID=UPI0010F90AB1|nr:uncharacterized protein LOC114874582 [Osmia bicornis bicornis]
MDLVYIPEVLTYGFFRAPQYRDYEQPWNTDYFSYDKSTQAHSQRLPQHHQQKLLSKDNCYLCRENKRRSLAAYIRGKSRKGSCHEIHEEEEEEHDVDSIKEANTSNDHTSKQMLKNGNERSVINDKNERK